MITIRYRELIHDLFDRSINFFDIHFNIDLDYMKCVCTNNIINYDGSIDEELSKDYTKHAGCWRDNVVYLRPNVFRYRCKGHTPKERNKYIVKIICHELGHELYNNHHYSLNELHVPVIKTRYALSYKKQDMNLYKEELYADSIGLYVASKLYPNTEDIKLGEELYKEGVNYFENYKILLDY